MMLLVRVCQALLALGDVTLESGQHLKGGSFVGTKRRAASLAGGVLVLAVPFPRTLLDDPRTRRALGNASSLIVDMPNDLDLEGCSHGDGSRNHQHLRNSSRNLVAPLVAPELFLD